jgi:hypothetical protein
MICFFDLEILEREAGTDSEKFLWLLYYHHTKSIPKNRHSKYKPSKYNLNGTSWLLKPDKLFELSIDNNYIVQYIKLAARRSYSFYKFYGIKTLDRSLFPDLNLENIKTNPLLKITNNLIYFKYEEI